MGNFEERKPYIFVKKVNTLMTGIRMDIKICDEYMRARTKITNRVVSQIINFLGKKTMLRWATNTKISEYKEYTSL